ncbi:MAG: S41 family peptidase [Bacteroidales bacterium]|nr:S41 family peptidase [Bacteroidales bacterium]
MKRIVLTITLLLFISVAAFAQKGNSNSTEFMKMGQTMNRIADFYVDEPDMQRINEKAISTMLSELDPHSVFIPAKEVQRTNEGLEGKFYGIGVMFQILKDSVHVVEVVRGGPAEKVGMLAGDVFVKVNGNLFVGDSVTNSLVMKRFRGDKGTKVSFDIKRRGHKDLLHFDVVRDVIPINSIDTYFMIDKTTGYIRLDRFARTTMSEFRKAVHELKEQGMTQLIFDLRGNGGGFLDVAAALADEFLPRNKTIVYTKGRDSTNVHYYKSTDRGDFETGRLVVLIDEYSASASEIVTGAVQDHDRGLVIGRRSFGKGLVQRIFELSDGSQIRLTIARYYTPSGRCIQKPYKDGLDAYYRDIANRYSHKEMITTDSISLPDSMKYYTAAKRVVYGGGGIIPDIFIPVDTTRMSDYWISLNSKGLINRFALEWTERNRTTVLAKYPKYSDFVAAYPTMGVEKEFDKFVKDNGVEKSTVRGEWAAAWVNDYLRKKVNDTVNPLKDSEYASYMKKLIDDPKFHSEMMKKAKDEDQKTKIVVEKSDKYIYTIVKSLIVRNLYGVRYYYETYKENDEAYETAVRVINDNKMFQKFKINN